MGWISQRDERRLDNFIRAAVMLTLIAGIFFFNALVLGPRLLRTMGYEVSKRTPATGGQQGHAGAFRPYFHQGGTTF